MTRDEKFNKLNKELIFHAQKVLYYQKKMCEIKLEIEELINEQISGSKIDLDTNLLKALKKDYPKIVTYNCFYNAFKEWTVRDLVYSSPREIENMRGIGEKRLQIITTWMKKKGLMFFG